MKAFTIAKLVAVNPEGKILALRRSATDTRRPLQWDFPGGFVESDEDFRAAVMREAQEEAGLACRDPRLVFALSEMKPADKGGAGTWLTFVDFLEATPEITLSFEHDAYKWVDPQVLLKDITYDRQKKMLMYLVENNLLAAGK